LSAAERRLTMRRPEDSTRRRARIDLRLPLIDDDCALPWRAAGRRDAAPRPLDALLGAAHALDARPGALLLGGGDPLRRADLRELLTGLAALRPDGLGLCVPGHGVAANTVAALRGAGVQRLCVPFHCARQDAHDWLVGEPGALRVAHRAIRAAVDGELAVTAEVVITRPTMAHLAETVEVLARLGVRAIIARRLTEADAPGAQFVALAPRLALLEPHLERAAAGALERRVRLSLRELPLCVAPRLRPLMAPADAELWVDSAGVAAPRTAAGPGCATCPGAPHCAGAPADYVARFGWEEFLSASAAAPRIHEDVVTQREPEATAPMAFSWGGPRRLACAACGDAHHDEGGESTRAIRARMVVAARQRPAVLRLVGAELLAHPQAASLIHDALRLFPRVEIAGEASAMAEWIDVDLRRLKDVQRFDVALFGPDAESHDAHCGLPGAFAATLRAVQRLRTKADVRAGAYALLHDARQMPAWAAAWDAGQLPGAPRFRLSAGGGSLDELIEAARALPEGRTRAALLAVLPHCLAADAGLAVDGAAAAAAPATQQQLHFGRSMPYDPCGADPLGAFAPCGGGAGTCATPGCPGRAVGWHSTARSQRWGSI